MSRWKQAAVWPVGVGGGGAVREAEVGESIELLYVFCGRVWACCRPWLLLDRGILCSPSKRLSTSPLRNASSGEEGMKRLSVGTYGLGCDAARPDPIYFISSASRDEARECKVVS